MKFKLLTLVLLIVASSCKEEKIAEENQSTETEIEKKKSKKLQCEVDLTTSHPDEFKLFSNNVFLNNNQSMSISIAQKLNQNETNKRISFEFPENIVPDYNLGISLGNKNVKTVALNNVKISFGIINYQIPADSLDKYFTTNRFVEFDKESKTYSTKKIDGNHNPMIFLRNKYLLSLENQDN